jgi:hypothetical protein
MKIFFSIIFISLIVLGCGKGASKLDVNDIEAHRAYQDTLIVKVTSAVEKMKVIRNLISEYRNLDFDKKESNSNYNYYLARLYSYINSIPMNGVFYDSVANKAINLDLYKNFNDSAFYFSEISLKQNPNNIRAMWIYSSSLFWETERYKSLKAQNIELPFSSIYDNKKWNDRMNYLYANFSKFADSDTSKNKELSKDIFEFTFPFISNVAASIVNNGINWNDDNDLYIFVYLGKCFSLLNKNELKNINEEYFTKKSKELLTYTRIANDKIKLGPIRNFLDKDLYQRGWSSTSNSLDGDIQTSNGNFIEYKNASISESELVVRLNSDFTYNITFQPIRFISTVNVSGKWKLVDNGIEFEKDIFVKVPVTSADFPISEEPFYEYILIPKKAQILNGFLVLDKRSTNRNTFFVQLAIIQQNNAISDDLYAFNSLINLSLEKNLLTQYLGYYK